MELDKSLLWNKKFVEKRIIDQRKEIDRINKKWSEDETMSIDRYNELKDSAIYIRNKFQRQLDNINKLK